MPRIAALLLARVTLARWLSPRPFARLAARLVPHFAVAAVLLVAIAFGVGLLFSPADAAAHAPWALVFLHAPAAWMALFLYLLMTGWAVLSLGGRAPVPSLMLASLAPTGALFSAMALATGLLLVEPGRDAWWARDAMLGTQALVLALDVGVMLLRRRAAGPRTNRAQAALVLIGALNLPIIYLALRWWSTLHPEEAPAATGLDDVASTMFAGSLLLALAFWTYANAVILARVRRLLAFFEPRAPQSARRETGSDGDAW